MIPFYPAVISLLLVFLQFQRCFSQIQGSSQSHELFINRTIPYVPPCTDFYQHVCNDQKRSSFLRHQFFYQTIEEKAESFNAQLLAEATEHQLNSSSSSKAVTFLLDLHQQCFEEANRESGFMATLKADLLMLTGKASEAIFMDSPAGSNSTEQQFIDLFSAYYAMTGEGLIADLDVVPDLKNHSQSRIALYKNDLAFTFSVYFLHKLSQTPSVFNSTSATITELSDLHNRLTGSNEPSGRVFELIEQQEELTLGQITLETGVDWTEIINQIQVKSGSSVKVTEGDLVYADIPFLKNILDVIKATPARIFENYVNLQYFGFLSTVYSYNCRFAEGSNAARMFSYVSSRIYVEAFKLKRSTTEVQNILRQVTDMLIHLKRAYLQILQESNPLNVPAFNQLFLMNFSVGYANWILDDQQLDLWYGFEEDSGTLQPKIVKGNYMASVRSWINSWIRLKFTRRSGIAAEQLWGFPVSMINAWNHQIINHVYIPLGHLTPSMYNLNSSEAFQFGLIGFTIGHEIAHGFTSPKYSLFQNSKKCLLEQYSAIVDGKTGKNLNGTRTLFENFADNIGIRAAFRAFQNQKLGGYFPIKLNELSRLDLDKEIKQFTLEEQKEFFYNFAKRFCAFSEVDDSGGEIWNVTEGMNTHTAHRYRVNVPLGNFEQFAKTFNCPVGTGMNPVKKCTI